MSVDYLDFEFYPCDFVEPGNTSGIQPVMVPKGVMVRHKPSGMVAFCFKNRSQMKNRDAAIAMVFSGLCSGTWCDHPESKRLSWMPLEWCEQCGSIRHMIAGRWGNWTIPKPF